jgi:hypothetical protein
VCGGESWRAALERWHRWSAVGGDGGDLVKLLGGRVAARFVWCGAAGGQWRDLATKSLVWRCEACAGPVHGKFGGPAFSGKRAQSGENRWPCLVRTRCSCLWRTGPVWGKLVCCLARSAADSSVRGKIGGLFGALDL